MVIDVIIPTYKPGKGFIQLLKQLCMQTVSVNRVIVVNTDESLFGITQEELDSVGIELNISHIQPNEFDHGNTRREAVMRSNADVCIMMTQDAIPADDKLIEKLVEPLNDANVAVSYARQAAYETSSLTEKLTREFNYSSESKIKTASDLETMGIKAFFCSNVCSAYRRSTFIELDGFVRQTIFNEDMLYAYKAQQAGYSVAYCADAVVYHSHDYTGKQQFKRNFDNGVSHAMYPEVFGGIRQEGEGMRLVKYVLSGLCKEHKYGQIILFVYRTGCRYLGFKLGCRYEKLPKSLVLAFTGDKKFFQKTGFYK